MTIDTVIVAYRSRGHIRRCVEELAGRSSIRVIVVDNACPDHSIDAITDLEVQVVRMGRNAGFAAGCNAGARVGTGDAILFLNPDARMRADDARRLAAELDTVRTLGAVGPHLLETSGEDQPSMRRAPSLRTALAEASFLHHLFPHASWATEIVESGYDRPADADWLSGAALCVRRSAFESIGGFDERFFLYSEDADLCMRLREHGFRVRYVPSATAIHEGGGSAPRPLQAALRAEARIQYVRLHEHGFRYLAFRVAYALHEVLRLPVAALRSRTHLRGRLEAVRAAVHIRPRHESSAPSRVG